MGKKKGLRFELLKTMISLATAGFGLVAALAWNDAIQSIINKFFPASSGIISKLIYAVVITSLAVIITYILGKMIQETSIEEDEDKKS